MEIRTLLLLNLVLLCFYALGVAAVYATSPALRSIRWLIPAFASGATGTLILLACPFWPCFLLVNVVLLGACVLLHCGVAELTGVALRWPFSGTALLLLQICGVCYFLLHGRAAAPRILLFSMLVAAQLLISTGTLLRRAQDGLRVSSCTLALIFAAGAAYQLWRARLSLLAWIHADHAHLLSFSRKDVLVAVIFSAGILFGFLWASTERLRLELERMARTDSLTGVLNRRAFESEFAREMSRSLRSGTPLSMLLMDVDHFKFINDLHGHAAGDAVLRELAAILQRDLRRADLVARLGGEEFAALLPDTDADRATHTAERLRAVIEATQISSGNSRMMVTASFGVTAWQGDADAWERLLQRVDSAMYQAKQAGRNRVQLT